MRYKNSRVGLVLQLIGVAWLAVAIDARAQDVDPDATLSLTRARMYDMSPSDVWKAVPQALKAINLVLPKVNATDQFAIAWALQPMAQPRERRSELHVFVSPFAEPARVYVGSIMRTPSQDDPRLPIVQYNTGELEAAFFTALERAIGRKGEAIHLAADRRAATAKRLLGTAAAGNQCLDRLASDDPPAFNPETGVVAPQKIPESDVPPVAPGDKATRDRIGAEARVDVTITEDGAVVGARLINTATANRAFADAVAGAASLWHYRPSRIGGCAVPVRMTLAVQMKR